MTAEVSQGLRWGWRYLMCPPDHFEVAYEINPWMGGVVDPDRARSQWLHLVGVIQAAGAEVATLTPRHGLPDMVFTANAGLVDGEVFIAGRMRHAERVEEVTHAVAWARGAGLGVRGLGEGAVLEGLGDAMPLDTPAGAVLVTGHGARSNLAAHEELRRLTGRRVIGVHLRDPRWYHVDLTLCPLDAHRAIVFPDAYDAAGARAVLDLIEQPLLLTAEEAATFAANSIVVGRRVIMPACPPRVGRVLEAWGFDVVVTDVGEFAKAGGAVRCLTLPLDTSLADRQDTPDDGRSTMPATREAA